MRFYCIILVKKLQFWGTPSDQFLRDSKASSWSNCHSPGGGRCEEDIYIPSQGPLEAHIYNRQPVTMTQLRTEVVCPTKD